MHRQRYGGQPRGVVWGICNGSASIEARCTAGSCREVILMEKAIETMSRLRVPQRAMALRQVKSCCRRQALRL
jgi:hypothetical protein